MLLAKLDFCVETPLCAIIGILDNLANVCSTGCMLDKSSFDRPFCSFNGKTSVAIK
jgi:hypothetical protein